MKKSNRFVTLLLALAMVLTYMPAMAFAEPVESDEDPLAAEAVQNEGAEAEEPAAEESGDSVVVAPQKSKTEPKEAADAYLEDFKGGANDTEVTYYNDDGVPQTAYRTTDGLAYTLVNSDGLNTVRIIGYNGSSTTIDVPAEINGHPVSGFSIDPEDPIEKENYDNIKTIKLPDTMIYFRTRNLAGFSSLEAVTGTNGELDNDRYKTADGVLYKKYEKSMTAFYPQARKSTSWTMDPKTANVYQMPDICALEEITLSPLFTKDYQLTSIELPNLKVVNVAEDNEKLMAVDGVLFDKWGETLLLYPAGKSGKSYSVPEDTLEINSDAFYRCKQLESIDLPSRLEGIDSSAFFGCENLKAITIPDRVRYLGGNVFSGCTSLSSVTLSNNLTYINWDSFEDCTSLKKITIPDSVTSIEEGAFSGCTNLSEIKLPKSLECIEWSLFEDCTSLETITLPEETKRIYSGAFSGCKNLKKIIFTAKEAPYESLGSDAGYEFDLEENLRGLLQAVSEYGTTIVYPEGGLGYEELIAAINRYISQYKIFEDIPGNPEVLSVDKLTDVTIAPGAVKTFKVTADTFAKYEFEVFGTDDTTLNYDYCFIRGDNAEETEIYSDQTALYYDPENFDASNYFYYNQMTLRSGENYYLQVRASKDNTASDYKVGIFKAGPIGLDYIPENCEELTLGENVIGNVSSAEEVVTYKFTTPKMEVSDDEDYEDASERFLIEATRTAPQEDDSYYEVALQLSEDTYVNYIGCDTGTSFRSTQWLYYDKTYYIQFKPGTAGSYSLKVSEDTEEDSDDGFKPLSEVTPEEIESIALDETKTVEVTNDPETDGIKTYTYAFTPEVSTVYIFGSEGTVDTVGKVSTSDETIGMNDDSSMADRNNFWISFDAEAGKTYYLQARAYSSDEEGNTFDIRVKKYVGEHKHDIVAVAANEEEGTRAYYKCNICEKMYADEDCKHELSADDLYVGYGSMITGIEFYPADGCELKGIAGSKPGSRLANIMNFRTPGNKIVLSYDNNEKEEYIYVAETKEIYDEDEEDYYTVSFNGYYLDGQADWYHDNIIGCLSGKVMNDESRLAEGANKVRLSIWKDRCYAEGEIDVTGIAEHEHEWDEGVITKPASCGERGEKVCTCKVCGITKTVELKRNFNTHEWGEIEYVWDSEYTSVTATRECEREGCDGKETETVGVAEETVITAPGLDSKGEKTVTSKKFENEDFKVQVAKNVSVPTLRESAIIALENYKDPADYRENEKNELNNAIEDGKKKISAANDVDALNAALTTAKEKIDSIKTDAQLTAEEAKAAADKAAAAAQTASGTEADKKISDADKAADSASKAAESVLEAANKALDEAKKIYGENSQQATDAATVVTAAKKLVASTSSTKATVKKSAALVANNKAAAAKTAASKATSGTAAAVTLANESKAAAEAAAKAAAEAAAAAQTALDNVKAAYGTNTPEYDAAKSAYDTAASEKTKADSALKAAKEAATAAQNALTKAKSEEAAAKAKAAAEAAAKAKAAAAEAKAKKVTSVTVNAKKVKASTIAAAIKAAGGKTQYVKTVVLGKKVKKISASAFKGTKVTTLTVKSKKLTKKGVKKSLKGSSVKTIKVKVGNKKANKTYVKKYKKFFTKKNAGKKVKVK